MQFRRWMSSIFTFAALVGAGTGAQAVTTAGAGTVVVVPLTVDVLGGVYATEVVVRNLTTANITLKVRYYQSNNATAPIGLRNCTDLVVPKSSGGTSNGVVSFNLQTQCSISGGLVAGQDNFGMLVLEDSAVPKTNLFTAYSRTQTSGGVGFSVEGYPIGNFSGADADVIGLRSTVVDQYKANCFVGALGETVNYQIRLFDSAGAPIGNPLTGTLSAYQNTRILNVFTAALGAAQLINYSGVRATFNETSGTFPSFIGFCTQETAAVPGTAGSADFRIAKSTDAKDARQQRLSCYGQDDCSNAASVNNAATITDDTKRNIHYVIFDQPDFIRCDLVGTRKAELEMRLRQPGNVVSSPVFVPAAPYNANPPYTAGGADSQSFYIYTGERSTVGSGATTRWYIDVQYNPPAGSPPPPVLPIPYGITCTSGNGTTVPWLGTTAAAF